MRIIIFLIGTIFLLKASDYSAAYANYHKTKDIKTALSFIQYALKHNRIDEAAIVVAHHLKEEHNNSTFVYLAAKVRIAQQEPEPARALLEYLVNNFENSKEANEAFRLLEALKKSSSFSKHSSMHRLALRRVSNFNAWQQEDVLKQAFIDAAAWNTYNLPSQNAIDMFSTLQWINYAQTDGGLFQSAHYTLSAQHVFDISSFDYANIQLSYGLGFKGFLGTFHVPFVFGTGYTGLDFLNQSNLLDSKGTSYYFTGFAPSYTLDFGQSTQFKLGAINKNAQSFENATHSYSDGNSTITEQHNIYFSTNSVYSVLRGALFDTHRYELLAQFTDTSLYTNTILTLSNSQSALLKASYTYRLNAHMRLKIAAIRQSKLFYSYANSSSIGAIYHRGSAEVFYAHTPTMESSFFYELQQTQSAHELLHGVQHQMHYSMNWYF